MSSILKIKGHFEDKLGDSMYSSKIDIDKFLSIMLWKLKIKIIDITNMLHTLEYLGFGMFR